MSTQQRTFEVLKDPTGEKTEDVTVNIESHPDYNRVVHATCGDEPRGENWHRGHEGRTRGGRAARRRTRVDRAHPAEHRYSRDSLRLRPLSISIRTLNSEVNTETVPGDHNETQPLTQTRQHRDTGGIDSDTDIDTDYDTDSGTTYRTAESEVLA